MIGLSERKKAEGKNSLICRLPIPSIIKKMNRTLIFQRLTAIILMIMILIFKLTFNEEKDDTDFAG